VTESSPPALYGGAHTNFSFYTQSNQQIFISGFKRPNDKVNEGDRFLVLYLPEKPKTAVMLFDYPIKDSVEYKRYVNELERIRMQNK
jgi:23S rRNA A2030 N6-methylase RlmJ